MKIVRRKGGTYILRFEKGELYPKVFIRFLEKKKIRGGFFVGLGACVNPEISFYDLRKKKYVTRRFRGGFEVLNLTGNVAMSNGKIIIHPHTRTRNYFSESAKRSSSFGVGVHQHVTLGARNFKSLGGHLQNFIVGGTLEIFLTPTPPLKRKFDSKTGLNLFSDLL